MVERSEQPERTGFAALVQSVSTAYGALAEEMMGFATPNAKKSPEESSTRGDSCSGNSSKIRARQRELLAIIEIVGGTALRLNFLIMRAKTENEVSQFQSDLYTMLARDRGESYANGVIFHAQIPLPQKPISPLPTLSSNVY